MPWTLEHCPANEEWSKTFQTEAEAIAELRKHICESCMTGRFEYVDSSEERGFGVEQRKAPDPNSAYDLLSTPCGCEYELSNSNGER
jgi:hypothetical protein